MEKYFVGSNGDCPDKLYFDLESAKAGAHSYIDSFDGNGMKVAVYSMNKGEYAYTKWSGS